MIDKPVKILTFVIGYVQVWWFVEWRYILIGVYWNREIDYNEIYLCLLPCLPIRFLWPNRRNIE